MARRIDAGLARKAVALLCAQGLPVEGVLARAGLDTATLSRRGARIPFAEHVALLEHAAVAARDPCFGLHLGAALHPRDLGLVGYLGANAATLGDVLRVAGKYLPLLTEGTRVEVQPAGQQVRLCNISSTPPVPAAGRSPDWERAAWYGWPGSSPGQCSRQRGSSCRSTAATTRPSTGAYLERRFGLVSRALPSCWNSSSSRCAPSAPIPTCSIFSSKSAASAWERPTRGISALGRRT